MFEIRFLIWNGINTSHIAEKGIGTREIEEALLYGIEDIRRGRLVRRGSDVVQRYLVTGKGLSGICLKVVIEPVDRGEGIWRCVTAWKTR